MHKNILTFEYILVLCWVNFLYGSMYAFFNRFDHFHTLWGCTLTLVFLITSIHNVRLLGMFDFLVSRGLS